MKTTTFLIALAISTISWSQQTNETIDIGGVTRDYIQYLPVGFDPVAESLPVVFCLHGVGDNAQNMSNIGFNQIGDTARFISVYPQGLNNTLGQTSWANGTILLSSTANDLGFFHAMMNDLILNQNADPSRIYVSGFSMGSIMSYKLACEMNERVAAIGTMSGTMSTEDLTNCVPSYVTPVIHFHGTMDATVPYDAGALPSLSLVPETIDFWTTAHSCGLTSDSTQIPDTASDGYTVDKFVYQGCTPNNSVEFWRINGGDHEYFYQPVNDFTEAVEIWRFFSQWSHSNPADAGITDLTENGFTIYPNPTTGVIKLTSEIEDQIEIYSTTGALQISVSIVPGTNEIDLGALSSGVYIVKVASLPELSERITLQ